MRVCAPCVCLPSTSNVILILGAGVQPSIKHSRRALRGFFSLPPSPSFPFFPLLPGALPLSLFPVATSRGGIFRAAKLIAHHGVSLRRCGHDTSRMQRRHRSGSVSLRRASTRRVHTTGVKRFVSATDGSARLTPGVFAELPHCVPLRRGRL